LVIVGGFLIAALAVGWIIYSDLEKMAFEERMKEENAERAAIAERELTK
jgi:hypothetical protein